MEYTVQKLARLAGISARTLRFYDELGLLKPCRISSGGYRIYGERERDLLQQILFYRELELPLEEIKKIVTDKNFDFHSALLSHRKSIIEKRKRLLTLQKTVEVTLSALEGGTEMTDNEKFEGFKNKLIEENEAAYGAEIREKYGDEAIDKSNANLKGMSQEQYSALQAAGAEFAEKLCAAMDSCDAGSALAMEMVKSHRKTITSFGDYPKEVYLGLTQMYVDDPRFREYYEKIRAGAVEFLRDAAKVYAEKCM